MKKDKKNKRNWFIVCVVVGVLLFLIEVMLTIFLGLGVIPI